MSAASLSQLHPPVQKAGLQPAPGFAGPTWICAGLAPVRMQQSPVAPREREFAWSRLLFFLKTI